MFYDSDDRFRWVTWSCVGLVTLSVIGWSAHKFYRRHTLPERIASGQALFEHEWQVNDALSGGGDGLGPVFNEKSCVACHFQAGIGGSGNNSNNVLAFQVLPTARKQPLLNGVVHARSTTKEDREDVRCVSEKFPIIKNALTVRDGCITKPQDFNPVVQMQINSPALFGAGLIDEVSDLWIHGDAVTRTAISISEQLDADFSGNPVGRARLLARGRVGKFGWKGQFATLEEFVASACAVELGLTNPQKSQIVPREFREDKKAALDMTSRQLDELVTYIAALPRPVEVLPDEPRARAAAIRGKQAFVEVGCADCHKQNVGSLEGVYSDFRLYQLEVEQAQGYTIVKSPDQLPSSEPRPNEWKTPPLWGVADSAPYFHDGRSPTLHAAIARHGVDGANSLKKFKKLQPNDREAIVEFLKTLQAPPPIGQEQPPTTDVARR